jgi:uncharacterized coiled-coil protein SlyX
MADDLIARLRNVQFWQADCDVRMQAAARIEELEDNLTTQLLDAVNGEHDMTPHGADVLQAVNRIEELEDALAKVIEVAETLSGCVEYDYHGNVIGQDNAKAVALLAELSSVSCANLKGQDDE